jgi:hypothetical protein
MRTEKVECECPLCDGPAQAVPLNGLAARRIFCGKCTTYEISEGLEGILADNPEAKARARYLSDAAKRAMAGGEPLKLTEDKDNYLGIAATEEALQRG